MRRLFALVGLLLLTACSGSGSKTTVCNTGYWDGSVGTCVPTGWQALDRTQLDAKGMPPEVQVAFQSQAPVSGQFITVTVTREALNQPMTSSDYSQASISSVTGLPQYKEIDKQSTKIDGQDAQIHIFSAQPSPDQPASRFYQLSAVSNSVGYTFTAATPLTISKDVEAQVLSIMNSVTFTQAATAQ